MASGRHLSSKKDPKRNRSGGLQRKLFLVESARKGKGISGRQVRLNKKFPEEGETGSAESLASPGQGK